VKRLFRPGMGIFLLSVLLMTPCFSADYFSSIKEAITSIELGQYEKASASAERAVVLNDAALLGHMTLGTIYTHASRVDDARREFKLASNSRPDDWRPYYAMGVLSIGQGRWDDARKFFAEAWKNPDSHDELAGVDLYLSYVASGWKSIGDTAVSDTPLAREVEGIRAYKTGDFKKAASLLSEVLNAPAPLGFEENRSPLVTFDPSQPVSMPRGKLGPAKQPSRSSPQVSGRVILRADTSKTSRPSFVSFFIDDALAGVTNYAPFEYEWDTRRYSNGLHQVRVEAKNDAEQVISNKTIEVLVSNADSARVDSDEYSDNDGLEDQLLGAIRISESRKLAHYYLAKTYMALRDSARAGEQIRFALAYQPDFADAETLQKELSGSHPYHEISRGRTGSKMICLSMCFGD